VLLKRLRHCIEMCFGSAGGDCEQLLSQPALGSNNVCYFQIEAYFTFFDSTNVICVATFTASKLRCASEGTVNFC
jgi:hypothetical protein